MNTRNIVIGIIAVIVVGGLAFAGYNTALAPTRPTPVPTPASARTVLPDVVSAEAEVVPVREAKLSFKVGGRIAERLVKEGDQVKAGQVLAKLETRDLENAVKQAEAGLKQAEAQLARAKAGARAEEIAAAEAAVAIAEQGVAQAEAAVEVAKGNVASAQASLQAAQANLAKLTAGPTERDLEIARQQVELAKNQLWGLQAQRDAIGGRVGMVLAPGQPPLATEADHDTATAQALAGEAQVRITELQYEQLKAGTRAEDLRTARAQVTQAQAAVQIAQAELARAEKGVDAAHAQLQQAQAQRDLVKAGARAEDIQVADAGVAQAQAALATARAALEDAMLVAPFDGTVGQVNGEVGELAAPSLPVLTVGDLSELRVQTKDLSEVDVERVKTGQEVEISVDALPNKKFQGRVALIAPQAIERRGDIVYTVKIDLLEGVESGLRWGMTAFVDIKVGK
jgi:multidrug efflux pump subunit AcrA (membrane-fusion protein)